MARVGYNMSKYGMTMVSVWTIKKFSLMQLTGKKTVGGARSSCRVPWKGCGWQQCLASHDHRVICFNQLCARYKSVFSLLSLVLISILLIAGDKSMWRKADILADATLAIVQQVVGCMVE